MVPISKKNIMGTGNFYLRLQHWQMISTAELFLFGSGEKGVAGIAAAEEGSLVAESGAEGLRELALGLHHFEAHGGAVRVVLGLG